MIPLMLVGPSFLFYSHFTSVATVLVILGWPTDVSIDTQYTQCISSFFPFSLVLYLIGNIACCDYMSSPGACPYMLG